LRELWPACRDDVDLLEAYGAGIVVPSDRPHVRVNMITSLDGAISVAGRSGPLGGPADRALFMTLRALADVVVVGAGTMRAERYGPAKLDAGLRAARVERGLPPIPSIAVVTASAHLDWTAPFFTKAEARPLVITGAAGADALKGVADVADVVVAGEQRVDVATALTGLAARGIGRVLVEGGPGLNADFSSAGRIDELCLTLSPRIVQGDGPRMMAGPALPEPVETQAVHILEDDGFLFLRLRIGRQIARQRDGG
jgi:riboflavin biosynthesis pyrimidine reductase